VRAGRSFQNRREDPMTNEDNVRSVSMDEYECINDETDSDRTENSEDSGDEREPGSVGDTPSPDVDVVAKRHGVQNAIGRETQISGDAFCTKPINSQSANCEEDTSQRPRRNLRRQVQYIDYSNDFANSQYVRRIRRHCSRGTSLSAVSVDYEWASAMTSQGTPSLIGSGAGQAQASAVAVQFVNESFVDLV